MSLRSAVEMVLKRFPRGRSIIWMDKVFTLHNGRFDLFERISEDLCPSFIPSHFAGPNIPVPYTQLTSCKYKCQALQVLARIKLRDAMICH